MTEIKKQSWLDSLAVYKDIRMVRILLLGSISGFPWVLIASSLSLWLKEEGLSRSTIGWAGLIFGVYAFNYLWAPIIDRIQIPLLTKRLGHRRGWIVLMQIIILLSLVVWSLINPSENLALLITVGLIIAIASATQDITVDALRIEQINEKGEKISKSKGNGITIDQWLKYASPESLSLYMYQNPKRAKKLYKEIVPKAVDEYLDNIEKSKKQTEQQLVMNPVWHVHNGNIPKDEMIMSFSMLLNLVETSNADNKDLLWKFVKKYKSNIHEINFPIFDGLVGYAIKYFNDVIKAQKKYKKPSKNEKLALQALVKTLEQCNDQMSPEDIQTLIYSTGKENGYVENLRDWFKLIYEVVFGDENGPRMGFFISFFGVNETKELIISKLK